MLGYIYARSGELDDALQLERQLLERARRGEAVGFDVALVNPAHVGLMAPMFEDLRSHPSFERIQRRIGLQKR